MPDGTDETKKDVMNFFSKLVCTGLLVAAFHVEAAPGISLTEKGALRIDDTAAAQVTFYNDQWNFSSNQEDGRWKVQAVPGGFSGEWDLGLTAPARLTLETGSGKSTEARELLYRFSSPVAAGCNSLSVQFELPAEAMLGRTVLLDDKTQDFPADVCPGAMIAEYPAIYTAAIPLKTGTLELRSAGPMSLEFLDFRPFGQQTFAIRVNFTPSKGRLTQAQLALKLRFQPYVMKPVDLSAAANSSFSDEAAGDGRGGWTDQGAENDFSCFRPAELNSGAIRFSVIDGGKNAGRECIVLGGGGLPDLPDRVTVPAVSGRFRNLYLLHSLAWPKNGPIGTIEVHYRNGSRQQITVNGGFDVANWWLPTPLPNGVPVWQGMNAQSCVGIYASKFALTAREEIESLVFQSNRASVWMIAGVTLSPSEVPLPSPEAEYVVTAGEATGFFPVENRREIVPGSALDFSFLNDAPAGKYGVVRAVGENFEFSGRPGEPVRFYGANLCDGANFPTHEEAERLAARLSAIGYNAVRFHHFDPWIAGSDGKSPDAEKFDRFFYLIDALKRRGIYFTLDLYTFRLPSIPALGPEAAGWNFNDWKLAFMLLPEAMADLKQFSTMMLDTVNPYTGSTLARDPALIQLSILNENTIFHNLKNASPSLRERYRQAFERSVPEGAATESAEARDARYQTFLYDVYDRYFSEVTQFVRELGYHGVLTDQNYIISPSLGGMRQQYGCVDVHQYWDHPVFPEVEWQFPVQNGQQSVIAARLTASAYIAPARMKNQPFTVTEFDFCYPNRYRAEGAPIFAAYAAFQNWSGLYRFNYAMSRETMFQDDIIHIFETVNDPIRLLSERIGIAFFRRGDVAPGQGGVTVSIPERTEVYRNGFPIATQETALTEKLVTAVSPGGTGDGSLVPARPRPAAVVTSSTGELTADFARKTFQAVTPRSEALVLPEGTQAAGRFLNVENRVGFGVFAAISLDGGPLSDSKRILLLHLTNAMREKERFRNRSLSLWVEHSTQGPILLARGEALLSLNCSADENWRLFALGLDGKREMPLSFEFRDGRLTLVSETIRNGRGFPAMELVRD